MRNKKTLDYLDCQCNSDNTISNDTYVLSKYIVLFLIRQEQQEQEFQDKAPYQITFLLAENERRFPLSKQEQLQQLHTQQKLFSQIECASAFLVQDLIFSSPYESLSDIHLLDINIFGGNN